MFKFSILPEFYSVLLKSPESGGRPLSVHTCQSTSLLQLLSGEVPLSPGVNKVVVSLPAVDLRYTAEKAPTGFTKFCMRDVDQLVLPSQLWGIVEDNEGLQQDPNSSFWTFQSISSN